MGKARTERQCDRVMAGAKHEKLASPFASSASCSSAWPLVVLPATPSSGWAPVNDSTAAIGRPARSVLCPIPSPTSRSGAICSHGGGGGGGGGE